MGVGMSVERGGPVAGSIPSHGKEGTSMICVHRILNCYTSVSG